LEDGRHRFRIDLPIDESLDETSGAPQHARCLLTPVGSTGAAPSPLWMVEVPPEVIPSHSEIFTVRARLFILALMQISGSVVSLARELEEAFEPATD
jgi:hypothetical protein